MSIPVTLVIPTLNRKVFLEATLEDISLQSYKNFDVLIVDQSDERYQYEIPRLLKDKIKIKYLSEKSASLARNIGLLEGSGEVIIFLDDDIKITSSEFISNHVRHYIDSDRSGVSGAILSPGESFRSYRHKLSLNPRNGWLFFPINYDKPTEIGNGWAGNLSVRRDFALKIGGMDGQFIKGAFREESDFCTRLVKKFGMMIYDPEAFIIHIGAGTGGLRTFGNETTIRGQHHFDGMFYFLFRNVTLSDYPKHLLSFFLVFYKKKSILQKPSIIFSLILRTIKGVYNGFVMWKQGPKIFEGY